MIQYAVLCPITAISASLPYTKGNKAPPAIDIINKADAIFVCFPSPFIARGQIAGHIRALASPSKAMNKTDVYSLVLTAINVNITPITADMAKAFD